MSTLYLDPRLDADGLERGATVRLRGDEARHAATVSRVRPGERIAVGDGAGLLVWGPVVSASATEVVVEVDEIRAEEEPRPALWLAQALAKGDRDELAIQAATELGVAGVVPWAAERSVSRWEGQKAARGRVRWQTIVREATKQSVRPRVPEVATIASTPELSRLPGLVVVLDPGAEGRIGALDLAGTERVTLVVGPEGGISARELGILESAGARRVRLGREVLRTSTAGPAALAALNLALGRW